MDGRPVELLTGIEKRKRFVKIVDLCHCTNSIPVLAMLYPQTYPT